MEGNGNLVIIPARCGSKGIPLKNILKIAGKPLIHWSIEQALKSEKVNRVIVSTDSIEIAEIAKEGGAEAPFLRPAEISTDLSGTESCLLHALDWLRTNENYHPKNIILLQATSPLRAKGKIDMAINKFEMDEADSLLSVCKFQHFLWQNNQPVKALYDYKNRPRRQDVAVNDIKLKENGSIYITDVKAFLEEKNRLCGSITTFLMEEWESFEIDNELDWFIVESILKLKMDEIC